MTSVNIVYHPPTRMHPGTSPTKEDLKITIAITSTQTEYTPLDSVPPGIAIISIAQI